MVLLVTGECAAGCFYCPLSAEKRGRDVMYANERRFLSPDQMIEEAELMDALGTGVTGGDPLMAIGRTVGLIRVLRERFGRSHHIHLYTASADRGRIARVAEAGLDEVRFHPPVRMWSDLGRTPYRAAVRAAKGLGMSVGLELPVIPGRGRDLVSAIAFADSEGLDFVNLNELEFSETNWMALRRAGFEVKDDISAGVEGSEELAINLLRLRADTPLHYCSASFKDGVQLRRRIMRRARNVRRPHELLTRDGTLLKGVVETADRSMTAAWLLKRFDIPGELVYSNPAKDRLEIAPWVLEEIADELELPSYIVEEYPTADALEVERTPLTRR